MTRLMDDFVARGMDLASIPLALLRVGPRMVLRRIAPVEHMTRRPPVVDRELGRVFGLGDRDLDLRKPGGRDAWKSDLGRDAKSDVDLLDNGGSKRF